MRWPLIVDNLQFLYIALVNINPKFMAMHLSTYNIFPRHERHFLFKLTYNTIQSKLYKKQEHYQE